MRFLTLLLLLLVGGAALAQSPGNCYRWRLGFEGYMGNTYASPAGVVADCEAYRQADYYCVLAGQVSETEWTIEAFNAQNERVGFDEARRFETNAGCPNCSALAGTGGVQNFTIGWSSTSGDRVSPDGTLNDVVGPVTAPPTTVCVNECTATRGGASTFFHSLEPSPTGLFRMSADYAITYTGASCSTGNDSAANPSTPPAPCTGVVVQLDNRTRCIPSSTPSDQPAPPTTTPPKQGNPAAGSDGTQPVGTRTPVNGDGGNGGGPLTPYDGQPIGTGGGADGGSGEPGEQEQDGECGFGPNPPCKIDETGTPNGAGAAQATTDAINANRDTSVQAVQDAGSSNGKDTGWGFSFALPTGCSPIAMPAFAPYLTAIDVCEWQPMIHDLRSLVWIAVTAWACIGMVGRAAGGT